MRIPTYLIRHSSGVFHFRLMVPLHLRPVLGRAVIKRSLRTPDPRLAQARALVLACRYIQAFDHGDEAMVLKSKLSAFDKRSESYVLKFNPDGTVAEMQTDGSAEDHQRLMEARGVHGGGGISHLPTTAQMTGIPAGIKKIALGEAIRKYKLTLKERDPKTKQAKELAINEFEAWMKKTTVVYTIGRTDLSEYKINRDTDGKGVLKVTLNNKFNYIKGFFSWAIASGYYPKGDNPAQGHITLSFRDKKESARRGWQPYNTDQLKALFNPETYKELSTDSALWFPLVCLYTGARQKEIAFLRVIDVVKIGEQWCFDINELDEDKAVKEEASKRKTPIHPDLIALGLLDRVKRLNEEKNEYLFPELNFSAVNGPADAPAKRWLKYQARLNIKARGNGILGLRSFRPLCTQTLMAGGVETAEREMFLGHEESGNPKTRKNKNEKDSSKTVHAINYESDLAPDIVAGAIYYLAELCLPLITWSAKEIIDIPALKALLK